MLNAPSELIILFIVTTVLLLLSMAIFISVIIYRYQQKQNNYYKDMETLKAAHENALLQSQIEIQEQTFQNISLEIHDNINQKLTLSKLYLNTLNYADMQKTKLQINDAVDMIGTIINNLSSLSHSLSSEATLKNGLVEALQFETARLQKTGVYTISFSADGNPAFLDLDTELLVFRMVQEALANTIKHANATLVDINLHFISRQLIVEVSDNGQGFNINTKRSGSGLQNIKKRASMLKGHVVIESLINVGTKIKINIPLDGDDKAS